MTGSIHVGLAALGAAIGVGLIGMGAASAVGAIRRGDPILVQRFGDALRKNCSTLFLVR